MQLTSAPVTTQEINTLCPLGCGRLIAREGDKIHYCVTRVTYGHKTITNREYVGTYDGEAMFYGKTNHDVEIQLRPYVEELEASELIRTATDLDAGMPSWETVVVVEPA